MASIVRNILLVLAPLVVVTALYLAFDPFEVLYRHERHYRDPRVIYNWDYNQTEVLLRNYPRYRFDSYIFGSSRSKAFLAGDWQQHLGTARVFHYAAMSETLFGVSRKLELIERQGMALDNCLLVMDRELLAKTGNSTGHLFIKHPAVSGGSRVEFHLTFFRDFISPSYLFSYLAYKSGLPERFVGDTMFFAANCSQYDPILGDLALLVAEREVARDPQGYYARQSKAFYPRPTTAVVSPPVIGEVQLGMLRSMERIFAARRTRVKVVLSPLYDRVAMNPADVATMRRLFGKDNVFDYSGVSRYSADIKNYYEPSHFRTHVARAILEDIYGPVRPRTERNNP
jgi:hypothetical protein